MQFKVFFLIDENLPFELLEFFRKRSYRAEHIKKINKSGIKNGEVYQYAEQKSNG